MCFWAKTRRVKNLTADFFFSPQDRSFPSSVSSLTKKENYPQTVWSFLCQFVNSLLCAHKRSDTYFWRGGIPYIPAKQNLFQFFSFSESYIIFADNIHIVGGDNGYWSEAVWEYCKFWFLFRVFFFFLP